MSGGSFRYLYTQAPADIAAHYMSDLEMMQETLARYGDADDAAAATQDIIDAINKFNRDLSEKLDALSGVFKAVEWEVSGDYDRSDVIEALEKYRKQERQS